MHIAFVADEVPNREFGSANHAAWCIIEFLQQAGHQVTACLLLQPIRWTDPRDRARWIEALSTLCELRLLDVTPAERSLLAKGALALRQILRPRMHDYYPLVGEQSRMEAALREIAPDCVVVYQATRARAALYQAQVAPRFAFEGDPDYAPMRYRWEATPWREKLRPRAVIDRLRIPSQRRFYLQLLRNYEGVGDAVSHHAAELRAQGVTQCRHVRNLVPDFGGPNWRQRRQAVPAHRPKLLMVDKGLGTHGRAGYHLFANEVLPILERRLGADGFEAHLVGRVSPSGRLARQLDHPSVRLRGYVKDIASEFLSADVLLVPVPIPLGHRARIVCGWSAGCCVVTHAASQPGLPELSDGENALVAEDGDGLAEAVLRVLGDPRLREKLGGNGRRVYESTYAPAAAGPALLAELARLVQDVRMVCASQLDGQVA